MSFYLPITSTHTTGLEPAEFLDLPAMADTEQPGSPELDLEGGAPDNSVITPPLDRPLLIEGRVELAHPE